MHPPRLTTEEGTVYTGSDAKYRLYEAKYTDYSNSVIPTAPNCVSISAKVRNLTQHNPAICLGVPRYPEGLKNCSSDDGEAEINYFSSWSINGSLK